jgi:hypothetical protein
MNMEKGNAKVVCRLEREGPYSQEVHGHSKCEQKKLSCYGIRRVNNVLMIDGPISSPHHLHTLPVVNSASLNII